MKYFINKTIIALMLAVFLVPVVSYADYYSYGSGDFYSYDSSYGSGDYYSYTPSYSSGDYYSYDYGYGSGDYYSYNYGYDYYGSGDYYGYDHGYSSEIITVMTMVMDQEITILTSHITLQVIIIPMNLTI